MVVIMIGRKRNSAASRIACSGCSAFARSPWIVAIPGTQNPEHARENAAAAAIELTDEQYDQIERIGKKAALLRGPT